MLEQIRRYVLETWKNSSFGSTILHNFMVLQEYILLPSRSECHPTLCDSPKKNCCDGDYQQPLEARGGAHAWMWFFNTMCKDLY